MILYLDPASIHAEMLKRGVVLDCNRSRVSISTSNDECFAWVHDGNDYLNGPADVVRDDEREDYHGLTIGVCRWGAQMPA